GTFADFDVNQKLYKSGKKFIQYEKVISYFTLDGHSTRDANADAYFDVMKENFGTFWEKVGRLYIAQFTWRKQLLSILKLRN
ncbi:MAG: hypothetical protein ABIS12_09285, partial [Bacteroidia bacterium]